MTTTKMTITEALSELNLIKKKIKAKQEKIRSALVHISHMPDAFASEGGSAKMINHESQSISDLSVRYTKIKAAITEANIKNMVQIANINMSIHDWLTWKREFATTNIEFLKVCCNTVKAHMDQYGKSPQVYKDANDQTQLVKYSYNIDYSQWIKNLENVSDIHEKLDGQLSLHNATVIIEI